MSWLAIFVLAPFLVATLRGRRAWPYFLAAFVALGGLFGGSFIAAGVLWSVALGFAALA